MKKVLLLMGAVLALGAVSCAKKQIVQPEEKVQEKEEAPEPATKPAELPPAQPQKPVLPFSDSDITGRGSEGEGIQIRQLKKVHFAFDDYSLSDEAKEILQENATFLKSLFEKFPEYTLVLEGHCDERGTEEYNIGLGAKRAESVKKYLVFLGVPEDRIETVSYGEAYPEDPGHNEKAWAKNRRVVFVLKKTAK